MTAREVLIDLLGSGEFDHEILDPAAAADVIVAHLANHGYKIVFVANLLALLMGPSGS
jgi:hypothetical protein